MFHVTIPTTIEIQTTDGKRSCPAYWTSVPGLVANRVDRTGRDWTLTWVATGRHFGVSLPTREDVLECVSEVDVGIGDEFDQSIADPARDLLAIPQDDPRWQWARRFQELAFMRNGCRVLS